jgi:threonine aldolase
VAQLKMDGILLTTGNPMRLVTHLDIDKVDIDNFIEHLMSALA